MPLNSILNRDFVVDIDVIKSSIQPLLRAWQNAPSEEERSRIESDTLALIDSLLDFEFQLQELKKGLLLEFEEMDPVYRNYSRMINSNLIKTRSLTAQFIKYYNSQQLATHHLIGKMRRVRQKRAALTTWSTTSSKYVIADKFLNLDFLDTIYTSSSALNVESSQGVMTLPVRAIDNIGIKALVVGQDSNGQSGNSDVAITVNNNRPVYAINGQDQNWFEYERLDAGPLKLVLNIQLKQEEIVNKIEIESVNFDKSQAYLIEDIEFVTTDNKVLTLADLTGPFADPERMVIKSSGNDSSWQISFLPVRARNISIKFRQDSSYLIQVANTNRTETTRKRWAIGIKSLQVKRVRYDQTGGINSVNHAVPAGLYSAVPFVGIWPANPDLYDFTLETSTNSGETWSAPENIDDGIGSTVLLDGTATNFLWRLKVDRVDSALDNATSYSPDESKTYTTDSVLTLVSPNVSPNVIRLGSKPYEDQVYAIQPRVARRGDGYKRMVIGKTFGAAQSIPLSLNILSGSVDGNNVKIFVGGRQYAYQTDSTSLSAGQWAFSDDYMEVILPDDIPTNAVVEMSLDNERMFFTEEADGFYHYTEFPFDSDKNNIDIIRLPRQGKRHIMFLPKDKAVIRLPHSNLISETLDLFSSHGTSYTEVTSKSLLAMAGDYFVDYKNGILHFFEPIGVDTVRLAYTHVSSTDLDDSKYEIIFDGAKPIGIRILRGSFEAAEYVDTVADAPGNIYHYNLGTYQARNDYYAGTPTAKILTYDRIVKGSLVVSDNFIQGTSLYPVEVPFIDGRTEFLGLIRMDNEKTPATAAVGGVATFVLSAGALWDNAFDPAFGDTSVFATRVAGAPTSLGEYQILTNGTVNVYTGAGGLPGGISIQYFYKDSDFLPENKYSVDYKNGAIYSYGDQEDTATISYKAASYYLSYDVGRELDATYTRSTNSASVITENMSSVNRGVKIIWRELDSARTLRDLSAYFSPLVEIFGLRFN